MLIDKQIHADELKLRILMTNTCSLNCIFCLNDFQPKDAPLFIDQKFARDGIENYYLSFKYDYPLQVYFSGGEPTLHPNLFNIMKFAKLLDCRTTLNTNGKNIKVISQVREHTDCLHFGVYEISKELAENIYNLNGDLQCVYSKKYPYVDIEFIEFYMKYKIPIKIFNDFFNEDDKEYIAFAQSLQSRYPEYDLSFRYTGIQENRGMGCNGCNKKCITLKAAWLFPDNTTSPCPQLKSKQGMQYWRQWKTYYQYVKEFHQLI